MSAPEKVENAANAASAAKAANTAKAANAAKAANPSPAAAVPSPCVSLCQMHAATGWCRGCLRTLDEIAGWSRLDDPGKYAVLHRLQARRISWQALSPALRASDAALPDGRP
jgi:predicted Fe-S protein YdhL (DUF1289 family)